MRISNAAVLRRLERLEAVTSATVVPVDDLRATVAAIRICRPNDPEPETLERARAALDQLPPKWRELFGEFVFYDRQAEARLSTARRRAIEAGRRSGKTVDRKAEIVERALDPDWQGYGQGLSTRYIVVGLPTQGQTNDRYFEDLRQMIPVRFMRSIRRKDPPILECVTGARVVLAGMDVPQRAEGEPIDDLFLDEFADMRRGSAVIDQHLRASLSTRGRPPGTVTVFGTPDMRSGAHFVDLCDRWAALAAAGDQGYSHIRWPSTGIIAEEEIEQARIDLDEATFAVEYLAERRVVGARAYYAFGQEHVVRGLRVNPDRPLILCFDWGWNPAVCAFAQEQTAADAPGVKLPTGIAQGFTAFVSEIFIERSNTPQLLESVIARIEQLGHRGPIHAHGDATGGSHSSTSKDTNLDLVRRIIGAKFPGRLAMRFPTSNPAIVARLNAMNARLRNAAGEIRCVVDASCRRLIRDFELVQVKAGAAHVEIDKRSDSTGQLLTHISDGASSYVAREFPIRGGGGSVDVDM